MKNVYIHIMFKFYMIMKNQSFSYKIIKKFYLFYYK